MAAVPPLAIGKRVSIIRCPVIKGLSAGNLLLTGLGIRIGHFCVKVKFFSSPLLSFMVTIVSEIVYLPSGTTFVTIPDTSGETMDLCRIALVSWTSAIMVPP